MKILCCTRLAVMAASMVTFFLAGPARAELETFYFGNDPAFPLPAVSGKITFDTSVVPTDIGGTGSVGERFLYQDAVTLYSFDSKFGNRTYVPGDIQVWNDYSFCISRTGPTCNQVGAPEPDRIMFTFQNALANADLNIFGNGQAYLQSAQLPTSILNLPTTYGEFFWFQTDNSNFQLASNHMLLSDTPFPTPTPIPEPPLSAMLLAGMLGGLALRRLRRQA